MPVVVMSSSLWLTLNDKNEQKESMPKYPDDPS